MRSIKYITVGEAYGSSKSRVWRGLCLRCAQPKLHAPQVVGKGICDPMSCTGRQFSGRNRTAVCNDLGRPCLWQLRCKPRWSSACRRPARHQPAAPLRGYGLSAISLQAILPPNSNSHTRQRWILLPSQKGARGRRKVEFSLKPILTSIRMQWSRAT